VGGHVQVGGNAWVRGNAWVGGYVRVGDNAWVGGHVQVGGNAWVRGYAQVEDNAWVGGYAQVEGNARVRDNVRIGGNAWIRSNADYLSIKGIGSSYRNTTAYKTKGGGIEIVCGCFSGTLEEFETRVQLTHGENKFAKEYRLFIEIMKLHFMEEKKGKQ
ncbi:MAG: LbetaH domain-containing protein, partial [Clostridiales bacterium]|nr:LbetaH domain-containing protein [Clostridiales bacterium]